MLDLPEGTIVEFGSRKLATGRVVGVSDVEWFCECENEGLHVMVLLADVQPEEVRKDRSIGVDGPYSVIAIYMEEILTVKRPSDSNKVKITTIPLG